MGSHQRPIISLKIGVGAARRDFLTRNMDAVPVDVVVNALVDTGASITILDESVVAKLKLQNRGFCKLMGFGIIHLKEEVREYPNYDVSLAIAGESPEEPIINLSDIQVVGAPLGWKDFEVLLGMDILELCRLTCYFDLGYFEINPLPKVIER